MKNQGNEIIELAKKHGASGYSFSPTFGFTPEGLIAFVQKCVASEVQGAWQAGLDEGRAQKTAQHCLYQISEPDGGNKLAIKLAEKPTNKCFSLAYSREKVGNSTLAQASVDAPVAAPKLDDAWKARMLDGQPLARDKDGIGYHPALPDFDESVKCAEFFASLGIELKCGMAENEMDSDAYEAMTENGLTDEGDNYNAWTPKRPDGDGWSLVAVFDTEDGPACWWMRDKPAVPFHERVENYRTRVDNAAVEVLAMNMKAKLAVQRDKGYRGWNNDCTQQHLSDLLRQCVEKGDPVDVANFCAFLLARGETIAPLVAPTAVAVPDDWMEHLGFELDAVADGVWQVVEDTGDRRDASLTERILWKELTAIRAALAITPSADAVARFRVAFYAAADRKESYDEAVIAGLKAVRPIAAAAPVVPEPVAQLRIGKSGFGVDIERWAIGELGNGNHPLFTHAAPQAQADARDAELLKFLQDQCIDLRCFTTSDGEDVGWRTVQHHMDEPRERVVSEVYSDQPRRAIREAMARIARDPYCTGPLHLEDDAAIAAQAAKED